MDKIKAKGLIPLALGGQGWQEGITFRSVLLAVGGKDLYMKTFRDRDDPSASVGHRDVCSQASKRKRAVVELDVSVDISCELRAWDQTHRLDLILVGLFLDGICLSEIHVEMRAEVGREERDAHTDHRFLGG